MSLSTIFQAYGQLHHHVCYHGKYLFSIILLMVESVDTQTKIAGQRFIVDTQTKMTGQRFIVDTQTKTENGWTKVNCSLKWWIRLIVDTQTKMGRTKVYCGHTN